MRKGLISVLVVIAASLCTVTAGGAVSCTLSYCEGASLVPSFGGSIAPKGLSRHRYAPVTASIFGKIKTTDGTHPPALREAVVDIDKDVKINVRGFPVCRGGEYDMRDPAAAKKVCGEATLGEGKAETEIAFPEQNPIKVPSPLLVFNGGERDGEVTLLIQTFITVPVPAAIVTRVSLTRKGGGLHAVARIPVIAGGSGSLLGFDFRLGKAYDHRGKKVAVLEARCPDGIFKVGLPKLLFRNEAHTPGQSATTVLKGSFAVPCTPQG